MRGKSSFFAFAISALSFFFQDAFGVFQRNNTAKPRITGNEF